MIKGLINQIKNGARLTCQFSPYGEIDQYIISANKSTTCVPKGNDNFLRLEEFLLEEKITPEYSIDWVEIVSNNDGNLLHYNTNIGRFVDSSENPITKEIEGKVNNKEIEIRDCKHDFLPMEIEVIPPKNNSI